MSHSELSSVKTWIVSAWWPEQEQLIDELCHGHLPLQLNERLKVQSSFAFLTTGVGTHRAAMVLSNALTTALNQGAPSASIYFVATAGAYDSAVPLDSAYVVSSALWTDGALLSGKAYLPQVQRFESINTTAQSTVSQADKIKRAVSTPGITLDPELAQSLSTIAELENLEIYGVALAATLFGVPWSACLGVSNTVGRDAHEQWRAHHLSASRAAQCLLKEVFQRDFNS